ncbi:ras-related protein RABD1-like [Stylophora pistillata]|nr:ras-related protein RABD1-like [Stylophora pistillata]
MERYEAGLTRQHYHGSNVVLLVYDCEEMETLEQLKNYYDDAKRHTNGAAMVLVGNKIDKEFPSVEKGDAEKILCNHIDIQIRHCNFQYRAETSAKTDTGIRELIQSVAEYLVKNAEPSNFKKVVVGQEDIPQPSSGCC